MTPLSRHMTKKKVTLETLAAQMAAGFAKHSKEIKDLTESVVFVVQRMLTKEDVREITRQVIREEVPPMIDEKLKPVTDEMRSMRSDIKELKGSVDNLKGLPKEIDHILGRVVTIEKHVGIRPKAIAS